LCGRDVIERMVECAWGDEFVHRHSHQASINLQLLAQPLSFTPPKPTTSLEQNMGLESCSAHHPHIGLGNPRIPDFQRLDLAT
jgi:hypothetical protein